MEEKLMNNKFKEYFDTIVNKFKNSKKILLISLGCILGLTIIILIFILSNMAPSNSVSIQVLDQHGDAIDGLKISLYKRATVKVFL